MENFRNEQENQQPNPTEEINLLKPGSSGPHITRFEPGEFFIKSRGGSYSTQENSYLRDGDIVDTTGWDEKIGGIHPLTPDLGIIVTHIEGPWGRSRSWGSYEKPRFGIHLVYQTEAKELKSKKLVDRAEDLTELKLLPLEKKLIIGGEVDNYGRRTESVTHEIDLGTLDLFNLDQRMEDVVRRTYLAKEVPQNLAARPVEWFQEHADQQLIDSFLLQFIDDHSTEIIESFPRKYTARNEYDAEELKPEELTIVDTIKLISRNSLLPSGYVEETRGPGYDEKKKLRPITTQQRNDLLTLLTSNWDQWKNFETVSEEEGVIIQKMLDIREDISPDTEAKPWWEQPLPKTSKTEKVLRRVESGYKETLREAVAKYEEDLTWAKRALKEKDEAAQLAFREQLKASLGDKEEVWIVRSRTGSEYGVYDSYDLSYSLQGIYATKEEAETAAKATYSRLKEAPTCKGAIIKSTETKFQLSPAYVEHGKLKPDGYPWTGSQPAARVPFVKAERVNLENEKQFSKLVKILQGDHPEESKRSYHEDQHDIDRALLMNHLGAY